MVVDYRKLIKFGDSSFVVSLPRGWIAKHNLSKGDMIYVDEYEGSLVLAPHEIKSEKVPKSTIIDVDNKSLALIHTEIVSSYLTNCDLIELRGQSIKDNSAKIKDFLHNLAGLEIVEQTKEKIVAKDLLNINQISIKSMIRRMDVIIRSMLEDCMISIEDEDHSASIEERDSEVNRLAFLTHRVIRSGIRDHAVAKTLGATHIRLLVDWQIITYLEKIADQCKRISRDLISARKEPSKCKEFERLFADMEEGYHDAMKSYYTNDKKIAYKIESDSKQKIRMCDALEAKCFSPSHIKIIYNMKGMITSIKNVARDVINCEE